jgi:hypothetical protein
VRDEILRIVEHEIVFDLFGGEIVFTTEVKGTELFVLVW